MTLKFGWLGVYIRLTASKVQNTFMKGCHRKPHVYASVAAWRLTSLPCMWSTMLGKQTWRDKQSSAYQSPARTGEPVAFMQQYKHVICRAAVLAQSDDEEHFQKKDKARLARDKLRLNPTILGMAFCGSGILQHCHPATLAACQSAHAMALFVSVCSQSMTMQGAYKP